MTYAHMRHFLGDWEEVGILSLSWEEAEIMTKMTTISKWFAPVIARRTGGKGHCGRYYRNRLIDHVTPISCGRGGGTSYLFGCEDKEEDDDGGGRNNDDLDKGLCSTEYLHACKTAVGAKADFEASGGGR